MPSSDFSQGIGALHKNSSTCLFTKKIVVVNMITTRLKMSTPISNNRRYVPVPIAKIAFALNPNQ